MNPPQGEPPGDAELISSVRLGDPSAFGVLYQRHAAAVTSVARYYANDDFSADDLVSEAFERTFVALRDGGGPDVSFRAYIYTAVRRLAFERTQKARRTHVTDDFSAFEVPEVVSDPAVDSFENRLVAGAFAGLPERWQAVLWYLEVEGLRPPEVAILLGLTANGVSALAYRAREGLREAYLQAHISTEARDPECDRLRGKLGAYVNGTLAARDTSKVDAHVRGCEECATIVAELRDDGHGLRAIVAPIILGGAAAAGLLASWPTPAATASVVRPARGHSVVGAVVAVAAAVAAVAGVATVLALTSAPTDAPPHADSPPPATSEPAPASTRPSPAPTSTPPPALPDSRGPQPGPRTPVAPAPPVQPTPTPTPTPVVTPILSVSMLDVGDLVLGRAGMVGVTAFVADAAAPDVTLTVDLPDGVTVDTDRALETPSGWACEPADGSVSCVTPQVLPDDSTTVFVPVIVSPSAEVGVAPTATVRSPAAPPASGTATGVVAEGLGTRFIADGRVTSTMVGSSFLSCDPALAGCAEASSRTGPSELWDNHSWALVALDRAGAGGVSAAATLDLPPGSTVAFAGVYWSADSPVGVADPELGQLDLIAPGGAAHPVVATVIDHAEIGGTDRYQAFADVTSIVAGGGAGDWVARGPLIGPGSAAGAGDAVASGSHAGWSLVVVYEHPSIAEGRVTVFDGFARVTGDPVSFTVASLPDRDVTVGVVAWEGDAGLSGDGVSLDGVPLVRSLGPADPGNVFASYAVGSGIENTFGVDVGDFEPTRLSGSRGTVTASTAGDHYVVGVVTVATR